MNHTGRKKPYRRWGAPHAVLMRRSLPFYVLEDRGVQLLADIIIANFPRQIPAKFYKKNLP